MILETALLQVKPGEEAAFEAAMHDAKAIIAGMDGFISLEVRPSLHTPSHYLLLVQWRTLEDHTVGFRGSPEYERWKALLHHFYDPFPEVTHFGEPRITA